MSEAAAAPPVESAPAAESAPAGDTPPAAEGAVPVADAAAEAPATEPAKTEPEKQEEPAADPLLTSRLAKLAAREKALREQSAKAREDAEAANAWRELQKAKTSGQRIDVLKKLFSDDEISESLYHDLTDYVLANAKEVTPEEREQQRLEALLEKREREAEEKRRAELAKQNAAGEARYLDMAQEAVFETLSNAEHMAVLGHPVAAKALKEAGVNPFSPHSLLEAAKLHYEETREVIKPADMLAKLVANLKLKTVPAQKPAAPAVGAEGGERKDKATEEVSAALSGLNARRRSVAVTAPSEAPGKRSRELLEELKRKAGLAPGA